MLLRVHQAEQGLTPQHRILVPVARGARVSALSRCVFDGASDRTLRVEEKEAIHRGGSAARSDDGQHRVRARKGRRRAANKNL